MSEENNHKNHVVFTFGRLNPPTIGHAKLINHVKKLAKQHNADHKVFISATHDTKKNPLTFKEKIHFVKKMIPNTHIHEDPDVKTPLDALKHLEKHGYKKVTMVVGQDRVKDFHNLLHKYNGQEYKFDHIHVTSAGNRDPDAEGVEGTSASKMREHAMKGNFKEFIKGVPDKKHAKELYMATRKGLQAEQFTALFLIGAPGSGKDKLLRETILNDESLLEVDLNKLYKSINEQKDILSINNGEPLIVNGNADNIQKILITKKILEEIGYKTGCIYVYTSDDISKQRNDQRIKLGAKTITEETRKEKYNISVNNIKQFKEQFDIFLLYNNSYNATSHSQELAEQISYWTKELNEAFEEFFSGYHSLNEKVEEFLIGEFLVEEDFGAKLNAQRDSAFKLFSKGRKNSKQASPPMRRASSSDNTNHSNAGVGLTTVQETMITTFDNGKVNKLTTAKKAVKRPFTPEQIRPLGGPDGGATNPLAAESLALEGTEEKPENQHNIARNSGVAAKISGGPQKATSGSRTYIPRKPAQPALGVPARTKSLIPPTSSFGIRRSGNQNDYAPRGGNQEYIANMKISKTKFEEYVPLLELEDKNKKKKKYTTAAAPPSGNFDTRRGGDQEYISTVGFEEYIPLVELEKKKKKNNDKMGAQFDPSYMEDLRTDTTSGGSAMQEQIKKKLKSIKRPMAKGDGRITPRDGETQLMGMAPGGNMGQTATESISFSKLRESLKIKSPDFEYSNIKEIYEDWGIAGEEILFEGRIIKTNKPFKVSKTKYGVYIKDGDIVDYLEFAKKSSGILLENLGPSDIRFWEKL